ESERKPFLEFFGTASWWQCFFAQSGGDDGRAWAKAQIRLWNGPRRGHSWSRRRSGGFAARGRGARLERNGADIRDRSALAEAASQQLAAGLDDRCVGGRAGPPLDHPSRRWWAP